MYVPAPPRSDNSTVVSIATVEGDSAWVWRELGLEVVTLGKEVRNQE